MSWKDSVRKATGSETKTPFGSKIFERDFVDTSVEILGENLEATVEWALEMYADKQGDDNWFSGMQVKVKKVSITDRQGKTHEWDANDIDLEAFSFYAGYGAKYSHGLSPAVVVYPSTGDLSTLDKIAVKFNPVNQILATSR
jgi:hypothetical protein|tara:strand:- start:57 stop:482 length:426 start_codon:yes stop_codon:yes gene_type:complete